MLGITNGKQSFFKRHGVTFNTDIAVYWCLYINTTNNRHRKERKTIKKTCFPYFCLLSLKIRLFLKHFLSYISKKKRGFKIQKTSCPLDWVCQIISFLKNGKMEKWKNGKEEKWPIEKDDGDTLKIKALEPQKKIRYRNRQEIPPKRPTQEKQK